MLRTACTLLLFVCTLSLSAADLDQINRHWEQAKTLPPLTDAQKAPVRSNAYGKGRTMLSPNAEPDMRERCAYGRTPAQVRAGIAPQILGTEQGIRRTRLFKEPLLPAGATETVDCQALAAALFTFAEDRHNPDLVAQLSPLTGYIEEHAASPWVPVLQLRLGRMYRAAGYCTRAGEAFEGGWLAVQAFDGDDAYLIANDLLVELARYYAWLGDIDNLDRVLGLADGRTIYGASDERLTAPRRVRDLIKKYPETALRCGPYAVQVLYELEHPEDRGNPLFEGYRVTSQGASLLMLMDLVNMAGLDYQVVHGPFTPDMPLPAIMHWSVGHYVVVTERRGNEFLVTDTSLGGEYGPEQWFHVSALEEESSGYAVIPSGVLPPKWRQVEPAEAQRIWGRCDGICQVESTGATGDCDEQAGGGGGDCRGMMGYSFHLMLTSLRLMDTPLWYQPARGPEVSFDVRYSQREATQPSIFSYSNLGPRWTHRWHAHVNSLSSAAPLVVMPGGGWINYTLATAQWRDSGDGLMLYQAGSAPIPWIGIGDPSVDVWYASKIQRKSGARLLRRHEGGSAGPVSYYLLMADGSRMDFELRDGANGFALMTRAVAPSGYGLDFIYDAIFRLVNVRDSDGLVTTLGYTHTDPLKITSVTDPFGRSTQLTYNPEGLLESVTDMGGLTSSVTYRINTDEVETMTTPYGTTTFSYIGNTAVIATDPAGDSEAVQRGSNTPPGPEEVLPVDPDLFDPDGGWGLSTYYWDKEAFHQDDGQTGAEMLHKFGTVYNWMEGGITTVSVLRGFKRPNESRLWFIYDGQSSAANITGVTNEEPTKVVWVETDGSTRSLDVDYDSLHRPIKIVGPLGRTAHMLYSTDWRDGNPKPIGIGVAAPAGTPGAETATSLLEDVQMSWVDLENQLFMGTPYQSHTVSRTVEHPEVRDPVTNVVIEAAWTEYFYDLTFDSFTWVPQAELQYNDNNLPIQSDDASGIPTVLTYTGALGDLIDTETDVFGRIIDYQYDGDERLQRVQGPDGRYVQYTYDAIGRVDSETDDEGYSLGYDYDDLNRLTLITYPDGTTQQFVYDRLDLIAEKDVLGRWTRYGYDHLGRLIATRFADGNAMALDWCRCGDPRAMIDARGAVTRWKRNVNGRVDRKEFADGRWIEYTYDKMGRIETITDPKGQTTRYSYYGDGKVKDLTVENAAIATEGQSYTYDAIYGRIDTMIDGQGTWQYGYHPPGTINANAVASVDGPLPDDLRKSAVAIIEIDGQPGLQYTSELWTDDGSQLLDSTVATVDRLGRTAQVQDAVGTSIYHYVGQTDRLDHVELPHGLRSNFTYDTRDNDFRMLSMAHSRVSDASVIAQHSYAYNAAGRIDAWTQSIDGGAAHTWDFAYDRIDQLVGAVQRDASQTVLDEYSYRYDPSGNRIGFQHNSVVRSAGFNLLNQQIEEGVGGQMRVVGQVDEPADITVDGLARPLDTDYRFDAWVNVVEGDNDLTVTATDPLGNVTTKDWRITVPGGTPGPVLFDANGNCIQRGSMTFEWDAFDRLHAIVDGSHRTEFAYNGFHQRVAIIEFEGGVQQSHKTFLWSGSEIIEERGADQQTVIARYTPHGMVKDGQAYVFLADHLGSVREVVDSSGAVAARYGYSPYGVRLKMSGNVDVDVGYTGHYHHAPTGLIFTHFRAYDPAGGVWLSRDPLGEVDGPNLYAYVGNRPINAIDPTGLLFTFINDRNDKLRSAMMAASQCTAKWDCSGIMSPVDFFMDIAIDYAIGAAVGVLTGGASMAIGLAYKAMKPLIKRGIRSLGGQMRKMWGKVFGKTTAQFRGECFVAGTLVLTLSGPVEIEAIEVGQRVVTDAQAVTGVVSEQEISDETHKVIHLSSVEDGYSLTVELLRSHEWIEAHSIAEGGTFGIELPEIGLSSDMSVVEISPCPVIEAGDGRIVTATFAHSHSDVYELDIAGLDEPIGVTAFHPFWLENEQAWVLVSELKFGDLVQTMDGTAVVKAIRNTEAHLPVYNIEVEGEHVYRVTELGVLVHNMCKISPAGGRARPWTGRPTAKQARVAASKNGWKEAKGTGISSHGQPVFSDGKKFYSADVDGHNGGTWKVFNKKGKRIGTADAEGNIFKD